MKRKKWSELEEQTLLSKYSDLLNSGTLSKLKTREKKFKPIADHVNSLHHLRDPITFPFKWSWRDVSIKVQNMRHQYLGVKQKIRVSCNHFNWDDGEIHWENFLNYKQVFGDIELSDHGKDATFGYKGKIGEEGIHDFSEEDDDEEDDSDLGNQNNSYINITLCSQGCRKCQDEDPKLQCTIPLCYIIQNLSFSYIDRTHFH